MNSDQQILTYKHLLLIKVSQYKKMAHLKREFSFRKNISPINNRSEHICTLPKQFPCPNTSLNHIGTSFNTNSGFALNNTSRFQQKKVLRRLKEQDVINRIEFKLKKMGYSDDLFKEALKFRPVKTKKSRMEKENID